MVETLIRTAGGRSAAEIVARREAIERKHFENWMQQLIANQQPAQIKPTSK